MERGVRMAGIVFGVIMIALSLVVTVETIVRKVFSISLGGVDELSGYAIAIGAPLAFAVAAVEQSHIRINLLYMRLPRLAQAMLNVVAALTLGILGVFFLIFTVDTVRDTMAYKAIAQTPWATPLIYPQALWLVTQAFFAVIAVVVAGRAIGHMAGGRWDALVQRFGPERVEDEVEAELKDLERR
ncbi:MAG: TRAP transporter small permease [Rhodospirillales bacterium]|jgi:TRAP-type C4-dicarboxylate transport system permease small subunit|nr:TRAP transporter small permease [Rhodospirillales bacterium]